MLEKIREMDFGAYTEAVEFKLVVYDKHAEHLLKDRILVEQCELHGAVVPRDIVSVAKEVMDNNPALGESTSQQRANKSMSQQVNESTSQRIFFLA